MGVKISELTSATSLTGSEELPIVQAGNTKKTTISQVKAQNYSTTEQVVGTWINGKPLYEITMTNLTPPQVTNDGTAVAKFYDLPQNVDYCFVVSQWYTDGVGQHQPLYYENNAGRHCEGFVGIPNSTNVPCYSLSSSGTAFNGGTITATFRYTKTTDTATRGGEQLRSMNTGSLVGSGEKSNLLLEDFSGDKEEDATEELQENKEAEGSGDDGQLR